MRVIIFIGIIISFISAEQKIILQTDNGIVDTTINNTLIVDYWEAYKSGKLENRALKLKNDIRFGGLCGCEVPVDKVIVERDTLVFICNWLYKGSAGFDNSADLSFNGQVYTSFFISNLRAEYCDSGYKCLQKSPVKPMTLVTPNVSNLYSSEIFKISRILKEYVKQEEYEISFKIKSGAFLIEEEYSSSQLKAKDVELINQRISKIRGIKRFVELFEKNDQTTFVVMLRTQFIN